MVGEPIVEKRDVTADTESDAGIVAFERDMTAAADRLESAVGRMLRVLAEETAWWAAGCPERAP